MDLIENKYIATFLLHAAGDTIGFKNHEWEFYDNTSIGATMEKLYEFIQLGGINDINLENWIISDDTILHIAVGTSLLYYNGNMTELENITVDKIVNAVDSMLYDKTIGNDRYVGNAVTKHTKMIKNGYNWRQFNFEYDGGGNGAAMRSNCIGLAFYGPDNRDKLIQYSINSSRITHVNPVGWLGGLSTALFTAYILENIHIYKWIPLMIELVESDKVKKYLTNGELEKSEYDTFIRYWKSYYESRFKNDKPVKTRSQINPMLRINYYNNLFDKNQGSKRGLSGYSAVIVAYDCLIDAENCWEKLVIYAILNNYDSDTIGAIACGLYGTMYGTFGVPDKNLKFIESKDKLIKIGKLMYKKYFKNEKIL